MNIIRVPNSLDSDQARHSAGPDLGPISSGWQDLPLPGIEFRAMIIFQDTAQVYVKTMYIYFCIRVL